MQQKNATVAEEPIVSKTVLLVEDQESIRRLIHNYLEKRGFHLLEAADGLEAMKMAQKHGGRIDVLITDISLPGADGVTLSKEIALGRPDMKTVFMSGQLSAEVQGLITPGFSTFLQKPFQLAQLLEKVNEMTGKRLAA